MKSIKLLLSSTDADGSTYSVNGAGQLPRKVKPRTFETNSVFDSDRDANEVLLVKIMGNAIGLLNAKHLETSQEKFNEECKKLGSLFGLYK